MSTSDKATETKTALEKCALKKDIEAESKSESKSKSQSKSESEGTYNHKH